MKEQLRDIQDKINNTFEYSTEAYLMYQAYVRKALDLLKAYPTTNDIMLENWKILAIEELEKELNSRLSEKFLQLHPDQQKSELKFSKSSISLTLMNVIMHL